MSRTAIKVCSPFEREAVPPHLGRHIDNDTKGDLYQVQRRGGASPRDDTSALMDQPRPGQMELFLGVSIHFAVRGTEHRDEKVEQNDRHRDHVHLVLFYATGEGRRGGAGGCSMIMHAAVVYTRDLFPTKPSRCTAGFAGPGSISRDESQTSNSTGSDIAPLARCRRIAIWTSCVPQEQCLEANLINLCKLVMLIASTCTDSFGLRLSEM